MKVILYRDGQAGVVVTLPDDDPIADVEDLLGGEAEVTALDRRLWAVMCKDGEDAGLPVRYAIHRMDKAPEPVAGDLAVVVRLPDRTMGSVTPKDFERAKEFVHTVGGAP